MISPSEINGHSLALILVGDDKDGEEQWIVVYGICQLNGTDLLFIHNKTKASFPIPNEYLERVQKVNDEVSSIIKAEYCIFLSVGNLPDDANESEYIKTGLKWPS